jgi:hypothetical protein
MTNLKQADNVSTPEQTAVPRYSHANCAKCGKHGYVTPLHGERGGPLCCVLRVGEWHGEHGRRCWTGAGPFRGQHRRTGRIVIRAKAYEKAGGSWLDYDKLKMSAIGLFSPDPMDYLAGIANTDEDETII